MQKSNYTISLDTENKIVRVVATGELDKDQGEKLITEARIAAGENNFQILCDASNAVVKVELVDWFFLPRKLPVLQDPKLRVIKTAVLISAGAQEQDYHFYEKVTHEVGMDLKIFLSEEKALEWLIGE